MHLRLARLALAAPAVALLLLAGPARAVNVDFNDLAGGTTWVVNTTHTSQGVDVVGETYFFFDGTPYNSGQASVSGGGFADGSNAAGMGNLNLRFDFGAVSSVSVDYDWGGGNVNLRVNGDLSNLSSDFTPLDGTTVAGGLVSVSATSSQVVLTGPITDFAIGGQEFGIDNVEAVPEPSLAVLLGLGGVALAGLRGARR